MRVSLCNEVIGELPFAEQCALAKRLGYDGIEIAPYTLSADPPALSAAQRADIRRQAADTGIAITSLHYLLRAPEGLSITTPDGAQRARTIEVMRRLCGLAGELGATVLVHGSPDQRQIEDDNDADGRARGVACFAAIADAAAAAGVTYCIEPLSRQQTAFINTVAEAAAIVRSIAHPALRTMIDCSAAGLTEDRSVADLIRQWVPTGLIGHIHFNDPNRQGPGDGALDFQPILSALRDTHYAGNAAIEPFIYEPDGPACAARNIAHIRAIERSI